MIYNPKIIIHDIIQENGFDWENEADYRNAGINNQCLLPNSIHYVFPLYFVSFPYYKGLSTISNARKIAAEDGDKGIESKCDKLQVRRNWRWVEYDGQ